MLKNINFIVPIEKETYEANRCNRERSPSA
jgi:hypothetical protein